MGTLPVLVACPHGGDAEPPGVPPRKGSEVPAACDFEDARDLNTREIAEGVAQRMLEICGEAPYVVIAGWHRKFIDANRSRECAFKAEAAAPFYDEYHATLRAFVDEIRAENGGVGLLFDIHGTAGIAGDPADIVYLGTANGETVARLLAADPLALFRRRSLRGYLEAAGHAVSPRRPGDPEEPTLSGGFTVRAVRQLARRRRRCHPTRDRSAAAQGRGGARRADRATRVRVRQSRQSVGRACSSARRCVRLRAMTLAAPAAGDGTIRWIGRSGCALVATVAPSAAAPSASRRAERQPRTERQPSHPFELSVPRT